MKDNVIPEAKWEFDENVTECFDDMLSRSIPDYDMMRKLVTEIGTHFIKLNTAVMDIGCSNGNAIAPFFQKYALDNTFYMLDTSEPMIQKCKERFGNVENICLWDITKGLPQCNASLILSILTLQFTPIEYRQAIVQNVYNTLNKGGAFILVEKVLGNTCDIDSLSVEKYYKMKSDNLYTQEQIQKKRKSLEGVLVPITAKWNEDLLKEAGFKQIDCFWRSLNFAGWVAIK